MKINTISKPISTADKVFNVVVSKCKFYLDTNGEAYMVSADNGGYKLTYLSYASEAKQFITDLYFSRYRRTVKKSDVLTAYETLCAIVNKNCTKTPVYTRVAFYNDTLYYDLANPKGEVIVINKTDVLIDCKKNLEGFFFCEDSSMSEQVKPIMGKYSILDFIEEFFNVDKNQAILLAVYICAAMMPDIKHVILVVEGEKGAGKTSLLTWLLKIINPVSKDVFALPKKVDDLVTTLSNNYFSIFDNIGKISNEISNTLCQASTGGNLSKRKLYSDNREISINIKRLVALNGINLQISQSDLLDRSLMIQLNRIEGSKRCPEEILNKRFNEKLPYILGSIFKILSNALTIYPDVNLDEYPRMADFSRYGYAIAEAIEKGYGDKFIEAYNGNINLAIESAIEENPLLNCLKNFAEEKNSWQGTMTELLKELRKCASKLYIGKGLPLSFPNSANGLSRMINTHKHEMENIGISVDIGRSTNRYVKVKKNN